MSQYILTLSDDKATPPFLDFIRKLDFIQKVEPLKPLASEDWAKPGRPATDEEFEQMVAEMEAEEKDGLGMSAEEAKEYSGKLIDQWLQNHK